MSVIVRARQLANLLRVDVKGGTTTSDAWTPCVGMITAQRGRALHAAHSGQPGLSAPRAALVQDGVLRAAAGCGAGGGGTVGAHERESSVQYIDARDSVVARCGFQAELMGRGDPRTKRGKVRARRRNAFTGVSIAARAQRA